MHNITLSRLIAVTVLVIGLWVAPALLLHGIPLVHLHSAPPMSGEIAQALGPVDDNRFPVAGKDFFVTDTQMLMDGTWAIATLHTATVSDPALVVLQKKSGYYSVVLGPGTSFDHNSIKGLPTDVGSYLETHGVVYVSN